MYRAAAGASSAAPDPKPEIHYLSHRKISKRQRASFRMAEIFRLIAWRREHGVVPVDDSTYVWALAVTSAVGRQGRLPIPGRQCTIPWRGLDLQTLRRALQIAKIDTLSDDELATIIRGVDVWTTDEGAPLVADAKIGAKLQLAPDERHECRIRTMDAVGESRAERQERRRERKREADKRRIRTMRASSHLPRHLYLKRGLEARQPWRAEGISRATWFRRRARETGVSHDVYNRDGATHLSQVGTTAEQGIAGPASSARPSPSSCADGHSARAKTSPIQTDPSTEPGLPEGRGIEAARLHLNT
jgi:hypothetical protein